MSASMSYHVNRLKTTIEDSFLPSRERSLALTKLEEVGLWLTKADMAPEVDYSDEYKDERADVAHWFAKYSGIPIGTTLGQVTSVEQYDDLVVMAMND